MAIRFQVDPDFYDHPKTLGMSDAATALWVRAGSYSAAKLTDGFVSDDVLVLLSRTPRDCARELTRRGLWSRVAGGYRFHQWESRNLTRDRVDDYRTRDRERKRAERKSAGVRANSGSPTNDPQLGGHAVRSDSDPDSDRSPPGVHMLSVSVSESVSVLGDGGASAPEPPDRCRDHRDDPDPPACRRCRDVRQRREAWLAERRSRVAAEPRCGVHPGEIAANCRCCAADRKAA